ncbi:MAG: IS1634 family transposase, partial [Patescibacteria group bacterium]
EFLDVWYQENGFDKLDDTILKDLCIARILEPASKLQTIRFLKKNFGILYPKNKIYNHLLTISNLKEKAEDIAYAYAAKKYPKTFSLVFYDVTTLYFETNKSDNLRKNGFSKDNKANQPQILIGLLVNRDGYPVSFDIFKGDTFEGNTFLPSILSLKKKRNIGHLTIVADAAMISFKNTQELQKHGLNYIVGARISSLKENLLQEISKELGGTEGIFSKATTDKGILICDYSKKRASKNRSDRKKQILKANYQIRNQSKITKKSRFLTQEGKTNFRLNLELIKKDEMIEGIKGYYTNLKNTNPKLIISRYKDLWQVEKSFRIAKSDLLARPIYHFKETSIKAHILIVFISLAITKSIELKTGQSIKKTKEAIWDIQDITLKDKLTRKQVTKRMKIENQTINPLCP